MSKVRLKDMTEDDMTHILCLSPSPQYTADLKAYEKK